MFSHRIQFLIQSVRLNIKTVETLVRCEIWMMSRVKNYLQDQLLRFTVVPLCDVLAENGKVEQEFTLSSSDIFYSPLDSVQLTLTYTGATLESLGAESSPSDSIPKQTSSAPSEEIALSLKESKDNAKAVDSTSPAVAASTFTLPVVNLNIAPEKKLVQQDIVDIHNKSMQQFAEDLEKMKLPLR
ncbi:hypothetical protein CQW23_28604 [Capsicum baccatum]|uniref:Uncharacterized protein n=1 Tax=Capsicum baccatum TaxID=33114 RepID=A0A2G2VH29_CAPBA|nr:hypothetical protein CQW23_28604 [Capsicum baccatum]